MRAKRPATPPRNTPPRATPTPVTLPPSATHALVGWSGVAAMLAAVTVLNFWPPFEQIAYLALVVIGCAALGVFVPDLLWQKVQRRALMQQPAPANWPRVAVKSLGL